MRTILLLVMVAGCGGGDDGADPHAIEPCRDTWDGRTPASCESACAGGQATHSATACTIAANCARDHTVEWSGGLGCCTTDATDVVRFVECQ